MKVMFPRGLIFDLDNIPSDFETKIQKAFHDFTEGTRKDRMFIDKLLFIDRMVDLLHGSKTSDTLVDEWLDGYAEYERKENGYFITENDAYSWESMTAMVELGRKQHSLYSVYEERGSRTDDKIMHLLVRAIKAVINYEGDVKNDLHKMQ